MPFVKISKAEAKKRFAKSEAIFLCPCKLAPDGPFSSAALVYGKEYLEKAKLYIDHPTLWKGSIEATAWDLMFNNWKHYNASYECGYYPTYYIQN